MCNVCNVCYGVVCLFVIVVCKKWVSVVLCVCMSFDAEKYLTGSINARWSNTCIVFSLSQYLIQHLFLLFAKIDFGIICSTRCMFVVFIHVRTWSTSMGKRWQNEGDTNIYFIIFFYIIFYILQEVTCYVFTLNILFRVLEEGRNVNVWIEWWCQPFFFTVKCDK